jgi:hypothetical protein
MHIRAIFAALGLWAVAATSPAQQTPPTSQLSTIDMEAAMRAVQSNRAALLDAQLQDQIQSVRQKEDAIQKLSKALNAATALRATLPAAAPAETPTPAGNQIAALELAVRNVGLNLSFATLGQRNATIQNLRTSTDSTNSALRMDQLRLQSLTNKRNEGMVDRPITDEAKKLQATRPDLSKMR